MEGRVLMNTLDAVRLFLSECAYRILLAGCMTFLWLCHYFGGGVWRRDK
jgi:hypothetical protein